MKRTYAFIMAGAIMLMTGGLTSCSGENTTGVDTTNTEAGGGMNNANGASGEYGEGSTEDYDNVGAGGENTGLDNNDAPMGRDTARTTTPAVDNGF